jgi:hypothetical protein
VVLLQVQADVPGGVARRPDRAQSAPGQVEEFAGDDLPVGQGGGQTRHAARAGRAQGREVLLGGTGRRELRGHVRQPAARFGRTGPPYDRRVRRVHREPRPGRLAHPPGQAVVVGVVVGDDHAVDLADRRTAGRKALDQGVPRGRVVPARVDQDRSAVGVDDVDERGPQVGCRGWGLRWIERRRRGRGPAPWTSWTPQSPPSGHYTWTPSTGTGIQSSYLMDRQTAVPGRHSAMTELVEHRQLFIGGELTDPLGKDVIEVISPHTEEVIGRVPHASSAGRGPRGRGRPPRLRRGALAAHDPRRTDRGRHPHQGRDRRPVRGDRPRHLLRERVAVLLEHPRAGPRRDDGVGRGDHRREGFRGFRGSYPGGHSTYEEYATASSGRSSCAGSRLGWSRP